MQVKVEGAFVTIQFVDEECATLARICRAAQEPLGLHTGQHQDYMHSLTFEKLFTLATEATVCATSMRVKDVEEGKAEMARLGLADV